MGGVVFSVTSFGVGAFVRFKSKKSHPWTYGIYRGVEKNDQGRPWAYTFSQTPLGPVTRWLAYWPDFIEAATVGKS